MIDEECIDVFHSKGFENMKVGRPGHSLKGKGKGKVNLNLEHATKPRKGVNV